MAYLPTKLGCFGGFHVGKPTIHWASGYLVIGFSIKTPTWSHISSMSNCFTLSRSSCAWQQQPMTLKSRTWQPPEENKSKKGRFWQTSVNFTSETDVFQPKKTHHAATAGQCIWASKSQNFVYFSGGIPVFVLNIYFLTSCEQVCTRFPAKQLDASRLQTLNFSPQWASKIWPLRLMEGE